jgi:hypothetical protein
LNSLNTPLFSEKVLFHNFFAIGKDLIFHLEEQYKVFFEKILKTKQNTKTASEFPPVAADLNLAEKRHEARMESTCQSEEQLQALKIAAKADVMSPP